VTGPLEKKTWCCSHLGVGCPSTPNKSTLVTSATSTATSATRLFDCDEGSSNWEVAWSLEKKTWCCSYSGVGCPAIPNKSTLAVTTTSTATFAADLFDCDEGYSEWQAAWPREKKTWCCSHFGVGCPSSSNKETVATTATSTTTSATDLFDCDEGSSNWEVAWPREKKTWCCSQGSGLGCDFTSTTITTAFDCAAGYSNWRETWSRYKRDWCCENFHLGCPQPPTTDASTTTASRTTTGISTLTRTDLVDCNEGFSDWVNSWPADKKQWCCGTVGLGCEVASPTMTTTTSSLTAAVASSTTTTTTSTTSSTTTSSATSAAATSKPFDCDVAASNWQEAWSPAKKEWCCQETQVGCRSAPFDCGAGYSNWREGWSRGKKEWCCVNEQVGCEGRACVSKLRDIKKDTQGMDEVLRELFDLVDGNTYAPSTPQAPLYSTLAAAPPGTWRATLENPEGEGADPDGTGERASGEVPRDTLVPLALAGGEVDAVPVPVWMSSSSGDMNDLMKMARGVGSVNAKTQYKGGAGSSQAGKGSATPSKPKGPKGAKAAATPKSGRKETPKSKKVAPEVKMTPKCIHSRAYYRARKDALDKGLSAEKALKAARAAGAKAVRDLTP
ncbi:unnamed protein product, partial [Prorocentrum cordatum]